MKNKFLLLFATIFIFALYAITLYIPIKEERAENLISNCIKDYLTYPESYETISTRIDSSFINVSKMEEIIELTEDCADLYDKIRTLEYRVELAQSRIEIYANSSSDFSIGNYNRAIAEKKEYKFEIKQLNPKLEEKVLALRKSVNDLYDSEINGWAVTHRFRCQNDYGAQMPPQEMLFFCDLNFESCQGWTAKQIESFFTIIECVEESETDKALLKNLQDIRYIFNYF